jgi:tripartite-type tricarboxylate transporter receptor subunit TctC
MRRTFLKGLAATAVAAASFGLATPAVAQDAMSFYEGKAIKFIVPYKPGGGYDEYARLIAPFLEKYTGARVDIDNMPGSGGMKGAVEIFKAPADGLTIGIINGSAMVTNELAEIEGAEYKVADYNFLGRIVADLRVFVVASNSGLNSIEDVLASDNELLIGATGLGGSTYVDAVITADAFGINQKVVHGFNSSGDIRQAMARGDVAGMWGSYGSARKGHEAGDHKIILHSAKGGAPEVEGIPSVYDLAAGAADPAKAESVMASWDALSAVGRPIAAPPGVPEDRVAFLRKAFDQAMADPEFVEIAAQGKRDLAYASGEDMNAIAKAATDLTDEIRAKFVAAIRGEI